MRLPRYHSIDASPPYPCKSLIFKDLFQRQRWFEKNSTKGCHSVIHWGNSLKTSSYLWKSRNGVFYARFIVPKFLRDPADKGREIRISTTTKDPREGVARARVLRVAIDQAFHSGALCSRDILTARLQTLMSNFRRPPIGSGTFNTDIRDGRYVATDIKPGEGREAAETVAMLNRDYLSQITTTPPPAAVSMPPKAKDGTEIHHPAFLSDLSLTPIPDMVKLFMADVQRRVNSGNLGPKAYSSQQSKLDIFVKYFGNVAIGSLDPKQIHEYELDLESYPKRRDIHGIQPAWTVRQVISAVKAKTVKDSDGNQLKCLSPSTVSGYMVVTRQFLTFAALQFAVNPLTCQPRPGSASDKKTRGKNRKPFDDSDFKAIFENAFMSQAQYKHAYQYWIPLIAAFTGARIGEISQMYVSDIIDFNGIPFFNITDEYSLKRGDGDDGDEDAPESDSGDDAITDKHLKNAGSRRHIPIHSKLLEMGFIQYVEQRKQDKQEYLFELNRNGRDGSATRPSRWFNAEYLRRDLGIKDTQKVFHSFRHSFITRQAHAIIEFSGKKDGTVTAQDYPESSVLRRLVGHSDVHVFTGDTGRPDAHDGYQHAPKPEVLQRVLERFTLDVNFTPFVMPPEVEEPPRKSTIKKVVKTSIVGGPKSKKPKATAIAKKPESTIDYGIGYEDVDMGKFFK